MRNDTILLVDGAMGTMLQKAGLKSGEKPEEGVNLRMSDSVFAA